MRTKKLILYVIAIGIILLLVIFRMHKIEEGPEEVFLSIVQIVQVNQEDKTLLVKGIGENNLVGKEGYVYCKDTKFWRLENEESVQSMFTNFNIGDIILLEHGLVMETYPTQLYAKEILSMESKNYESTSSNYSVTHFQEGNPIRVWEDIQDAQYDLIRVLIHEWITTSSAREGKDLSNLFEYYIVKEIDKEGEITELIIYKMADETYIQWGRATEFIVYNMTNQSYSQSQKATQGGQCMPIDNRLYNLVEQLFP